jgi:hypothetical protein
MPPFALLTLHPEKALTFYPFLRYLISHSLLFINGPTPSSLPPYTLAFLSF